MELLLLDGTPARGGTGREDEEREEVTGGGAGRAGIGVMRLGALDVICGLTGTGGVSATGEGTAAAYCEDVGEMRPDDDPPAPPLGVVL
jgi:hypothetical protein